MKIRNLHSVSLFAAGVVLAFAAPQAAHALDTITVTPCSGGKIPVMNRLGTDYSCKYPSDILPGEMAVVVGDEIGGIGSGGGAVTVSAIDYMIPKAKNNPYPANCHSQEQERYDNATYQVVQNRLTRIATGQGVLGTGTKVRVYYDDNSYETWEIDYPLFSNPLSPVPDAGSLTGCNSSA